MAFKNDKATEWQKERNKQGIIRASIVDNWFAEKATNFAKLDELLIGEEGTIEDLADSVVIGEHKAARYWNPNIYTNKRDEAHWMQTELFVLDIDHDLRFQDALARCERFHILPAFAYSTMREVNEDRYRLVWRIEEPLRDIHVWKVVQAALLRIFPEADTASALASQGYQPGKKLLYTNYKAMLDYGNLFDAVVEVITEQDPKNAGRNITRFCKDIGLNTRNGYPWVLGKSGRNDRNPYNIYIGDAPVSSTFEDYTLSANSGYIFWLAPTKKAYENEVIQLDAVRNVDWESVDCPVFRDFMNGVDHHHFVTLWVAMNLIYVEGGEKVFFQGLHKRSLYNEEKWQRIFKALRKKALNPPSYKHHWLQAYYPDMQMPAPNLLALLKNGKRGSIEMLQPIDKYTVEEQRIELAQQYADALTNEHKLTILRYPTGIGKTKMFEQAENVVIAVPTHALKNEVVARCRAAGNNVFPSPDWPEDLDEGLADYIDRLHTIGANRQAARHLRYIAETNPVAAKYIEELEGFYAALKLGLTVITTHARLMFLQFPHDAVIIDEDILTTILPQSSAKVGDILYLLNLGINKITNKFQVDILHGIKRELERAVGSRAITPMIHARGIQDTVSALEGLAIETVDWSLNTEKLSSNVLGFLRCDHFMVIGDQVHYIKRRRIPGKKIILFSATASEFIYKRLYPDTHFVRGALTEQKGRIIQYTRYSCSRESLKSEQVQAYIRKHADKDAPTITHITSEKHFSEDFDIVGHFGAIAGLNQYEGQDMNIFGTPTVNGILYDFLAHMLNIPRYENEGMTYAMVERNGMRFPFMAYRNNPDLQTLQLDIIEAELVQAVGRPRTATNDCVVTIFSNYPVPGAEYVY